MDFLAYQQQYVTFMKSIIKTRLIGILSQEIFEGYPDNLPKKYQKQMYEETLYMRGKAPKPEQFSPYTKHTLQLLHLDMYNINFIHKIGKNEHLKFLETDPPLSEVYSLDNLGEELPITDMSFNEFQEFLKSDSELVQRMRTKAAKKEQMQQAWLFDHWLYYQEFVMIMSLLESFFRDSYDIYREVFPNVEGLGKSPEDSDNYCFPKLFNYLMTDELKLVQRVGSKNIEFLHLCWKFRNAIVHSGGLVNERVLKGITNFPFKIDEQITIDINLLANLYSLINNLQRIIYKRIRLLQK